MEVAIINPLFKEGHAHDLTKYLLVCLLSHIRKAVDTVTLSLINEQETSARSLFGFQKVIAIIYSLLEADQDFQGSMRHFAVVDLEKEWGKDSL